VKPMLADDYDESKLVFPLIAEPKIDGVRGLNLTGKLTGRSLKPFGNRYTSRFFSYSAFTGLDGELAAAHECDPALCRLTTSALGTHEGDPFVLWWLFDYVTVETVRLPYVERYELLCKRVEELRAMPVVFAQAERLRVVPCVQVHDLDELNAWDAQWLEQGYEGTIIRKPSGGYKYGRSTVREGGLLRIKRFVEEDAVVTAIIEGQSNQNEAIINALGQTERSTHQENMVPNGMVGAFECIDVKTGNPITVSAGTMSHEDRVKYFKHPELILDHHIKYKHFPKGVKDKPRFPTFQSIRMKEDQ
jgi:DNA ligase 1